MNKIPPYESDKIEFKSTFNAECIEALVAFSNSKGGAVYVGVNDNGDAIGVSIGKESISQWSNEIKWKTEPSLIPDIEVLRIGRKQIILLSVKEFPIKPVAFKGKYFKRVGNSNHLLSLNEIFNYHLQSFNSSWDYYCDINHSLSDISEEKVFKLISLYNKQREYPVDENVYEFLSKMELVRDNKLTHAGFLLLMKNESVVSTIELGRFQDDITIKDGVTISTDLISEVDAVFDFIKKHIKKAYIITGNPAREERWDYPLEALREIVMNMIVHRDYAHHGDSSVKIYDNRIEYFNPGNLPEGITEKSLITGNYVSNSRNKLIAKMFKNISWIEKYGSGIKRIIKLFVDYGSPAPVFENFQHGFKVTVFSLDYKDDLESNLVKYSDLENDLEGNFGRVCDSVSDLESKYVKYGDLENDLESNSVKCSDLEGDLENNLGKDKDLEKELSDNQRKILEELRKNAYFTQKELAGIIGINEKNIRMNMKRLKEKGLIRREGGDKVGCWKVLKNV